MESLNVLITAASRRVPLVRGFQAALATGGMRGRVVVTDVNPLSPAVHAAGHWYAVPLATSPDYIDTVLAICAAERIGLVVPTIDDELELFGRAIGRFNAQGIKVAVSPESTSRTCNDKYATARFLRGHGIRTATTFLPAEVPAAPAFPLFIKPRFGRGGVGAFPVNNPRDLAFFLEYVDGPIVQEYLDGPEFTIDVLCDFKHRPLSIVPRERVVIRSGVIDRGRTVRTPALMELGQAVASVLTFAGAANIQCRVVNGEPIVFEINPRFSGGIPLTIAAGADFPRLLVELGVGRKVRPSIGEFRDNLWMTNYESSIFVDGETIAAVSPQSPVASPQSSVASHRSPVTSPQSSVVTRQASVATGRSSLANRHLPVVSRLRSGAALVTTVALPPVAKRVIATPVAVPRAMVASARVRGRKLAASVRDVA